MYRDAQCTITWASCCSSGIPRSCWSEASVASYLWAPRPRSSSSGAFEPDWAPCPLPTSAALKVLGLFCVGSGKVEFCAAGENSRLERLFSRISPFYRPLLTSLNELVVSFCISCFIVVCCLRLDSAFFWRISLYTGLASGRAYMRTFLSRCSYFSLCNDFV